MTRLTWGNGGTSLTSLPSRLLAVLLALALVLYVPIPAKAAGDAEAAEPGSEAGQTESTVIEYNADADFSSDRIIVTYADAASSVDSADSAESAGSSAAGSDTSANAVQRDLSQEGIEVTQEIAPATETSGTTVVAEVGDGLSVEEALQAAASVDGVARVQPDYRYQLLETTSDEAAEPEEANAGKLAGSSTPPWEEDDYRSYYLGGINAEAAWGKVKTGHNVTVAVLDTGCVLDHEDLEDNLLLDLAADFGGSEGSVEAKKPLTGDLDEDSHGTHVCGLVGAVADNSLGIQGISYNANVLPICVFELEEDDNGNENLSAYSSSIVAAYAYLDQLIEQGELTDLRVINLSLGAYSERFMDGGLSEAIDSMRYDRGVITVCAAGNGDGYDGETRGLYPSDYPSCFSVMALSRNTSGASPVNLGYSRYSDYNSEKDIAAPGGDPNGIRLWSTVEPNGYGAYSGYGKKYGTSMACPVVSGGLALLFTANPDMDPTDVMNVVQETAISNDELADVRPNCGCVGGLDLDAAVDYAREHYFGDPISLEGATVSFEKGRTSYEFCFEEIKPGVTVTLDGETLREGFDYRVVYKDNYDAGTATATVEGIGKYEGTASKTFQIKQAKLQGADLSYTKATYSGEVKRPKVSAYTSSYQVAEDIKYSNENVEITYASGRKYVGKYAVTVTGRGNITGSVTKYFTIRPKSTSISSLTSLTGGFKAKWYKRTIQTFGYEVRYSRSKSFSSYATKRITTNKVTSRTVTGLKRGAKYYVKVRTYRTVNGTKIYSAWSSYKSVKTK